MVNYIDFELGNLGEKQGTKNYDSKKIETEKNLRKLLCTMKIFFWKEGGKRAFQEKRRCILNDWKTLYGRERIYNNNNNNDL